MNVVNLPSPGLINGTYQLRQSCADAISAVEISRNATDRASLAAFFIACAKAAAVPGQVPEVVAAGRSIPVLNNAGTVNAKSPAVAEFNGGVLQVRLAA